MCKYRRNFRNGIYLRIVNLKYKHLIALAIAWSLLLLFLSWVELSRGPGETSKQYDILINSYMRSGSSFMGQLLAFQPDTFYWYEPLWSLNGLYYFMGRYPCVRNNICGDFGHGKIARVQKFLDSIYSCNFGQVPEAVSEHFTPNHSGAIWNPYQTCRGKNNTKPYCLKVMEHVCKGSRHRATKIVRLTVDNLEHVLEHHPNVKAIHLIRDPRAIVNSKITTKWSELIDSEQKQDFHIKLKSEAQDLCTRMKYDLLQGEKLKQKYSNRFAFVIYEDLQTDLRNKAEMLYTYFGIGKSAFELKLENNTDIAEEEHTVNKTQGGYTDWWRFRLSFREVKIIQSVCEGVLSFLGYSLFSNESDAKNVLFKAFNFRKELLISNLNKNQLYDFKTLQGTSPYARNIIIKPKHGRIVREQNMLLI